jgi:hypothetical protein
MFLSASFPEVSVVDAPFDSDAMAAAVAFNRRNLPASCDAELAAFVDGRSPFAAVSISGVPVGALPSTPQSPQVAPRTPLASFWLLTVARSLGQPVGYVQEHGGDLVQNIVPVQTQASQQTSTSSAVTLAWHTETAFHPHRPRWLVLLCLRGDRDAATRLVDVRDIVACLDEGTVETLRQPRFDTGVDRSFGTSVRRTGPAAVVYGPRNDPKMWFDADLMRGVDVVAQRAFDRFTAAVEQVAVSVVLETGQCLVIDNERAAHGRSPFTARFDGTDRWLQRAFVVADLSPSVTERTGRVITTSFS